MLELTVILAAYFAGVFCGVGYFVYCGGKALRKQEAHEEKAVCENPDQRSAQ